MRTRELAIALSAAIAVTTLAAAAQAASKMRLDPGIVDRACGTAVPTPEQMNAVQATVQAYSKAHLLEALAVGGQIKVAFHVIYSGSEGNIPQSQIDAQITELNRAYAGGHGGVNTGYTFVLASVDRTNHSRWFKMVPGAGAERQAKQALALDVPHRLNVYTCKPGQNLLGWSYFPDSYPEGDWHHGVVIHYGSVPGGYLSPYNLGGTLDHEVGHYLGLYHTFQGGCNPPGDYVSDTPDEGTATSGCPEGKDTCPTAGLDPIHNYMDYSTDVCYTQFTSGQDSRMDSIVPVYRPSLLGAALLASLPATESLTLADRTGSGVAFRGAWPNPFSRETALHFVLARSGPVSLKLYTVAGQLVKTLVDGEMSAGAQAVTLRAGTLAPGMYFAALRLGEDRATRSVVLVP